MAYQNEVLSDSHRNLIRGRKWGKEDTKTNLEEKLDTKRKWIQVK